MLSKSSIYEIKRLGIGILILSLLMLLIFIVTLGYDNSYLLGALLGAGASYLNFIFLAFGVENSVKRSKNAAKGYMGSGYFLRLAFIAVVIYFAINSPYINHWAAIIPLIFPRIVIMILGIIDSKKGEKGDEC